jgi:DNA-binding protein Fis
MNGEHRASSMPGANDDRIELHGMTKKQIDDCVRDSLEQYFKDLRGAEPQRCTT